jgi:hypothetical protein
MEFRFEILGSGNEMVQIGSRWLQELTRANFGIHRGRPSVYLYRSKAGKKRRDDRFEQHFAKDLNLCIRTAGVWTAHVQ